MKVHGFFWVGYLSLSIVAHGALVTNIVERANHHRLWYGIETLTNATGEQIFRTNKSVELKNGVCYFENGVWQDSQALKA